MDKTRYTVGGTYRFLFVGGTYEQVEYLGKNNRGMFRFKFSTGEVWTGHAAPIAA